MQQSEPKARTNHGIRSRSDGSVALARGWWHALYVVKLRPPATLPISPMTLACPLCSAKPGHDCETVAGIHLPTVHVARVKAAAARDAAVRKGRSRPTSLYEIESRDAEEKLAAATRGKK